MEQYREKADHFVATVKSAKRLPGIDEVYLPGERAQRSEIEGHRVQVVETYWESFVTMASEFGFTMDRLRNRWLGEQVPEAGRRKFQSGDEKRE
jgi:LDH2 family malate/lactate/ureidoglycolate dehydrogenase